LGKLLVYRKSVKWEKRKPNNRNTKAVIGTSCGFIIQGHYREVGFLIFTLKGIIIGKIKLIDEKLLIPSFLNPILFSIYFC